MMGTNKYLQRLTSQTGDTIVEVLLCLTILGVVVGTSSVLANRNTKTLQTTKEDSVALRLAQSQIEYLQAFAATNANWDTLSTGNICMQNSTTTLPAASTACTVPDQAGGGAEYVQNITLTKSADGSYILAKSTVSWETLTSRTDPATGKPIDPGKTEVTYKLYKKVSPEEDRRPGGGCPEGQIGTPPNCTPTPPQVRAKVQKIRPASNQTTPGCNSTNYESRSGTGVRLQGGSFNQVQTTGSTSEAVFQDAARIVPGTNYTATITSVPSGFQICNGTAQTGTLSTSSTIFPVTPVLTIRPICGTELRRGADAPVYSEWKHDVIGQVPSKYGNYRWERGARGGGGYLTDAWYGWMGHITQVGPYPNGKYYWLEWDGRIRSDGGAYWYNVWEAIWTYDVIEYAPVYGPWYRDIIRYDPTYYSVNVCPS